MLYADSAILVGERCAERVLGIGGSSRQFAKRTLSSVMFRRSLSLEHNILYLNSQFESLSHRVYDVHEPCSINHF